MEGRPSSSSGWLLLTGAAVGSALSLGLTWAWMPRKNGTDVDNECHRLREALTHECQKRQAERTGRVNAERQLRELRLSAETADALSSSSEGQAGDGKDGDRESSGCRSSQANRSYVVKPIGLLRSCFSQRNGTPRQPLLVPLARARLQLAPGVPPACLDGLEQYSHCWILYYFHCNTDLHQGVGDGQERAGAHGNTKIKAKVGVPRLNGARVGVLATRTPHRPNPIGLSIARIISVERGCLVVGGADIVDGSPVLDVKPYLRFCDSCPDASAPQWVQAEAQDEPLHVASVVFAVGAEDQLAEGWRKVEKRSLYASAGDYTALVQQALSRDIRSVHQRTAPTAAEAPLYHVVLEGVEVAYRIVESRVEVVGGRAV